MGARRYVEVTGGRVDVHVDEGDPALPAVVFLHEGLGSIELWRGFPADVAQRCHRPTTVVYSRHGYGRSDAATRPRPVEYMHHEADVVLPDLLRALDVDRPVLVGHSDGASISLLHAGSGGDVCALICIAPHVFVEPESIVGVGEAAVAFDSTDMAAKMARYHDAPGDTFRGWHDVWSSPEFRNWNIEDRLGAITAPTLLVQGSDDRYGTLAQLDAIELGASGPCERLVLDGVGHSPHLESPDLVAATIADFIVRRRDPPGPAVP